MRSSATSLLRSLGSRPFSLSATSTSHEKIVAAVLFERLPVVIPKIDPVVYAFQEFSLRWGQQYRRKYPDEVLGKGEARGKGDYQIDYVPAPRITEADKTNDQKRLYLLLYGNTYGAHSKKPVWHFPEKVYENEDTLRLCAESALKSVLGGLDHTYFVGNAPFAHMTVEPTEISPDSPYFKKVELRVSLHCKACEKTVRRVLCKLKGVTCVEVDMRSSKVTVLGYIDKDAAMKAIRKTGRRAEVWSNCCHRPSNSLTDFPKGKFKCIFWRWKKRKDSIISKDFM